MICNRSILTLSAAIALSLVASACGVDEAQEQQSLDSAETPATSEVSSAVTGASCVLGDGYVIPSGGSKTIYPVSCPSDCRDFPNGGLDTTLFCLNGVLGEWDPALTGGTVGPAIPQHIWNGNHRCTAKANPYSNPKWGQSADRKSCVQL
jgi:hypothetical protein